MEKRKYLFGPVPSRRFGRSLGVDLTPYKTCSFNCVFCQLGKTTDKTITRKEYVPTGEVITELEDWIKTDGKADYITLSGSGEPSLHSRFGEILEFVRTKTDIPAVLLTNGSLLYQKEVRDAASIANIVKVSLSAWDHTSYGIINRPHEELDFSGLVEGQKLFRKSFHGQLLMEVFLLWGINSIPSDVSKIASLAEDIRPDRIQLNTAVRPPVEEFAYALSKNRMLPLCDLFHPRAEIIAEFDSSKSINIKSNKEAILSMLERRPCTMDSICKVFGMHINEVSKYTGALLRSGQIMEERRDNSVFYSAVNINRRKDHAA